MKSINLRDLSQLRNELAKFRKGKKLAIAQFNQAARLAWLGRVVLAPLDPDDPACTAFLLYCERPTGIYADLIAVDEYLFSRIHVLDAEQGGKLREIFCEGIEARGAGARALNERDFYFEKFFRPEAGSNR
jgi:hypothetical protein